MEDLIIMREDITRSNNELLKVTNILNNLFRIIVSSQFCILLKLIIVHSNVMVTVSDNVLAREYMYKVYLLGVFIILFTMVISSAIYSKSIKNMINSSPLVLNRILGHEGEYENIFGEYHNDRDIVTMGKLSEMFRDSDIETREIIYILIHTILINKALKNFTVRVIAAIGVIVTLDLIFLAVTLGKALVLKYI
ncbi:MAG: hypothetical protein ACRCXX_08900, partial [Cetobacterium sp.]|uniref:hypothetical protein n=1 Tax=Cetobacterium sp. TaxID=2071632 RepID=UPI003F3096C2